MSTLFNFLRSASGALLFLLAALTAQVPHAATVYARIAPGYDGSNTIISYVYALALEGIILVFVLNQWQLVAWVFAAASIAINGCYYYWQPEELKPVAIMARALVSIALPTAIALYSHLVAKHTPALANADSPQNDEASITITLSKEAPSFIQPELFANGHHAEPAKNYPCTLCNETFDNHRQLNGHMKKHKS